MTIRRISRVRTPAAAKKTKHEMQETLKSIAKMQATIASLESNIAPLLESLQKDMEAAKLVFLECDTATADIVRSAGKSSNVINAKKFFDKVEEDDFFACATISVTKAKEILGQKELDKITKKTPGTPGEPKLKVTPRK